MVPAMKSQWSCLFIANNQIFFVRKLGIPIFQGQKNAGSLSAVGVWSAIGEKITVLEQPRGKTGR